MDNELMHYGILGMKWGRRKARNTSDDYKKSRSIKKKHVSEMSNQELKQLNERLQLEANYKNLTGKKMNIGKRITDRIINRAIDRTVDKSIDATINAGKKLTDRMIKEMSS